MAALMLSALALVVERSVVRVSFASVWVALLVVQVCIFMLVNLHSLVPVPDKPSIRTASLGGEKSSLRDLEELFGKTAVPALPALRSPVLDTVLLPASSKLGPVAEPDPFPALLHVEPIAESDPYPALSNMDHKFSVVMACADEGEYAVKTAQRVIERTPASDLLEVIVVDDGSKKPLSEVFSDAGMSEAERGRVGIRILRHPQTLGLMVAKKTGGDAARGGLIVFFDCHVAPQPRWEEEIKELILANPRRMVVPAITDLDIDTWDEAPQSSVNTKCYLTWDADFNWFDDASPDVPVMSGGLLALSREWWQLTGGYDGDMRGWGGENLDQSLRSWLCGGEIQRALTSRVAHMWRVPHDQRTSAHYQALNGQNDNRWRVVEAWYGEFAVKAAFGGSSHPDVSGTRRMQSKLGCKPFVHFLHRFRSIYVDGGMLPAFVFQLVDSKSGRCLAEVGGHAVLRPCLQGKNKASQWFHWANRDKQKGDVCCSGLRQWSTNMCLDNVDATGKVIMYFCDITGSNRNQHYRLDSSGFLGTAHPSMCLGTDNKDVLSHVPCSGTWKLENAFEPVETQLYREAVHREALHDPIFSPSEFLS